MLHLNELLFRNKRADSMEVLRGRVENFRDLVERNNRILGIMADAEEKLSGEYLFDIQYLRRLDAELAEDVQGVVQDLSQVTRKHQAALEAAFGRIRSSVAASLGEEREVQAGPPCIPLQRLGSEDAPLAGEKMARLGELGFRLTVPVPPGFVITAPSFKPILEHPDLEPLLNAMESSDASLGTLCAELQDVIQKIRFPRNIAGAIKSGLKLFGRHDRFSVRSSAIGEDGEFSYAGIYTTVMNVSRDRILEACCRVVASLFTERAVRYRKSHGLPVGGASMAVGCMRMVPAVASGVLYSFDPGNPESDAMLISASWGFGSTVVEGTGLTDRFLVDRRPPHRILDAAVAEKSDQWIPDPAGGLQQVPVDAGLRSEPSLDGPALSRLVALALAVERHMRAPQDIEWALDDRGSVWILQARPLVLASSFSALTEEPDAAAADYPVLMRGVGSVACRGIAAGRVTLADSGCSVENTPPGSVLVVKSASPDLAPLLPTAAALVADSGSPAGHLAALAREYRVPALMATDVASKILKPGQEVTVDTEDNVVYEGRVEGLIRRGLLQGDRYGDTREFRMLRGMLKYATPLRLRDPASSRFTPEQCSSYHDIIRYAHEKAVIALSDVSHLDWRHARRWLRRVALDIPLGLSLIDLGGGVAPDAPEGDLAPAHVACAPLAVLLEALEAPGVWGTRPADIDLKSLMSSFTRSVDFSAYGTAEFRRNLAIVSGRHMNLSLYLGYHFNIIDCYLGDSAEDSYMLFRFAGGLSDLDRRARRAELLDRILAGYGFTVERAGDLVLARLHGISQVEMNSRLRMVGRLIGFTRQLDVLLRDEDIARKMTDAFIAGISDPAEVMQAEEGPRS